MIYISETVNYSKAETQTSVTKTKQRRITCTKKPENLDAKAEQLANAAKDVVVLKPTTQQDKQKAIQQASRFCQRMQFILRDRLQGGTRKNGNRLWIGSWERNEFETFFQHWQGHRDVKYLRKEKKSKEFGVYITYTFFEDMDFMKQIDAKYEFVEDFEDGKRILRCVKHRYTKLTFLFNMQTFNVHCSWRQFTEKSWNGAWLQVC